MVTDTPSRPPAPARAETLDVLDLGNVAMPHKLARDVISRFKSPVLPEHFSFVYETLAKEFGIELPAAPAALSLAKPKPPAVNVTLSTLRIGRNHINWGDKNVFELLPNRRISTESDPYDEAFD